MDRDLDQPTPAFFVTGGTLRPDAGCYVERQADRDLHDGLVRGEFCYVLTPRQMGKSSLMVRCVVQLRQEGFKVAVLDLTAIGQNLTAEQWYDGLMGRLGQQLGLEDALLHHWRSHPHWGPLQRWLSALEQVVLRRLSEPLVIFIDEIDTVRSLPFSTDEFFAAIRECYNRRSQDPQFDRLTFGLLGVAAPADLIRDPRLTPFNIGRRIEVLDFTEPESFPLARGLSTDPATGRMLLHRILYWTGGQPFLTQRLCQSVVDALHPPAAPGTRSPRSAPPPLPCARAVDQICTRLFLEPSARERDDNLIFVRHRVLSSDTDLAALLALYRAVRRGRQVADNERDPLISVLKLSGLTTGDAGTLRVRNRIYQRVFDEQWISTHMPEAEIRRQRKAFRRGALIALASMLALLALLLALLVNSLRLHPLGLTALMPDGTRLTLDTVTHGRQHHYEPGLFRTAWLYRALGSGNTSAGKPSYDLDTPADMLTFWITRQDTNSGAYLNFDWWSHFELVDSQGCTFFGNLRTIRHDRNATGSYDAVNLTPLAPTDAQFIVASGAASTFPRRDKTILLRLYNLDQERVAEFVLPNPVYRTYPVWRPEPLPQTRRESDLAVTLTEFTSLRAPFSWHKSTVDLSVDRLTWQTFWKGNLTGEWQPISLILSDATGNARSLLPLQPEAGLCPHESAWSIQAIFYPAPDAAPENSILTWQLDDLSIPPTGGLYHCAQDRILDNLKVELLTIAGPGRFHLEGNTLMGRNTSAADLDLIGDAWFLLPQSQSGLAVFNPTLIAAGKPFLMLRVENRDAPPARLNLVAKDDQGRSVAAEEHREGDLYFLALDATPGGNLREARLYVRTPRQLEFLVRPPTPVTTTESFIQAAGSPQLTSFPPRDPAAPHTLIDLTAFYNASLLEDWHRQIAGNDLKRLPQGIQRLGGVDFDIRGIVQLAGTEGPAQRFPRQVRDIPIAQSCKRLHFLHAAGWSADRSAFVGQYIVRYADNAIEVIPLVFGQNTEDWWFTPQDPARLTEAQVVWTSSNRASLSLDCGTRLYKYTWTNPRPDVPVQTIDFISSMSDAAPFLIALTVD